jgi:hypothetical protein
MSPSYVRLVELLGQGWKIQPPVYVRPRWRSGEVSQKRDTYHFVLWSGNRVSLVSVGECAEVEELLTNSGLAVDRR